jgi:hypothetical protein
LRQLRLVGLGEDGASLLLESPTGESYRLPIDERVRAACRGDLTRLGQIEIEMDNPLRPREIQTRVRAGESAEQIAAASGMPLERVLRFAYAVLQERGRVIAQARSTAVGPRGTEALGDLVEERLISHGTDAATLEWDAWRREDGRWAIRLAWRHGDREHAANWSLDLVRRALQAEDPAAEQLIAPEFHTRTVTAVTPLAVAARAADGGGPRPARRAAPGLNAAQRPRPTPDVGRPAVAGPGDARADDARADDARADDARADDARADDARADDARADDARADDARADDTRADDGRPGDGRPSVEEIRAGGRRPGSDRRADPPPPSRAQARTGGEKPAAEAKRAGGEKRGVDAKRGGREVRARSTGRPAESRSRPGGPEAHEDAGDEPPADEVRQIASGGGTVPLIAEPDGGAEDDRARRATVPSWDDILLGVRRRH